MLDFARTINIEYEFKPKGSTMSSLRINKVLIQKIFCKKDDKNGLNC